MYLYIQEVMLDGKWFIFGLGASGEGDKSIMNALKTKSDPLRSL